MAGAGSSSNRSWADLVKGNNGPPDHPTKSFNVDLGEIGGWIKLCEALAWCGNLFGDIDFIDTEKLDYTLVRAVTKEMWKNAELYDDLAGKAKAQHRMSEYNKYSELAKKLRIGAQNQQKKDSIRLFDKRQKECMTVFELNCHDQHQPDAYNMLVIHLWIASQIRSIQKLKLITGYGKTTGTCVLQPMFMKMLDDIGIHYSFEENNPGVLIIDVEDIGTNFKLG
ncbi:uncharacterized protein LOC128129507 [Lactuca sativa]|uniref:uncharacterized protein LOC111880076 n=1 Tax=Lactuca sativa TaxID=4236 RepID=UPI000CD88FE5|nr:uncharacterized protein LOC111880076 [Lactuca sativa]XP_052623938.1 uncharacterized protein LOC128129507 [Lactuca sativa]